MKLAILIVVSLVAQVALGRPAAPDWFSLILLPTVFIIAPSLLHAERRWPHFALVLGLAWDLMLEPVVGPGAIAWSERQAEAPVCWLRLAAIPGLCVTRAWCWWAAGSIRSGR